MLILVLLIRFLVNSRLLVKFWRTEKFFMNFSTAWESATVTPMLFEGYPYFLKVPRMILVCH